MEFDGKVKYQSEEYTGGDPSQVVWRESCGRIGFVASGWGSSDSSGPTCAILPC